jgi:branched-chain amino acid transport system substrate-binding protein
MTGGIRIAGLALIGVAAMALAQPAVADIRIAVAGPITGSSAVFGAQMREGAEQAVADINAQGGVLGQKIVMEVADDACDPKQAVAVANRLAGDEVQFVVGHYCSGSSIPAGKVYTENGILMISPASAANRFTDEGDWNIFRTCGRDDLQGRFAGHALASEFAGKAIAILHDNSSFGREVAEDTKAQMNAEGLQEKLFTAYTPDEYDYSALISRLKAAHIDVVYIGGFHQAAGLIIRQAREQGFAAQFVGPSTMQTKELWKIGGPAIEGFRHAYYPDPRTRPTAQGVAKLFAARHVDPEGFTLYTYAAVQVWAEAVAKAGTVSPRKVAETLKAAGPWPTVLGDIAFDRKGDPANVSYVWYVWHNGNYAPM